MVSGTMKGSLNATWKYANTKMHVLSTSPLFLRPFTFHARYSSGNANDTSLLAFFDLFIFFGWAETTTSKLLWELSELGSLLFPILLVPMLALDCNQAEHLQVIIGQNSACFESI